MIQRLMIKRSISSKHFIYSAQDLKIHFSRPISFSVFVNSDKIIEDLSKKNEKTSPEDISFII